MVFHDDRSAGGQCNFCLLHRKILHARLQSADILPVVLRVLTGSRVVRNAVLFIEIGIAVIDLLYLLLVWLIRETLMNVSSLICI